MVRRPKSLPHLSQIDLLMQLLGNFRKITSFLSQHTSNSLNIFGRWVNSIYEEVLWSLFKNHQVPLEIFEVRQKFVKFVKSSSRSSKVRQVRQKFVKFVRSSSSSSSSSKVRQVRQKFVKFVKSSSRSSSSSRVRQKFVKFVKSSSSSSLGWAASL